MLRSSTVRLLIIASPGEFQLDVIDSRNSLVAVSERQAALADVRRHIADKHQDLDRLTAPRKLFEREAECCEHGFRFIAAASRRKLPQRAPDLRDVVGEVLGAGLELIAPVAICDQPNAQ